MFVDEARIWVKGGDGGKGCESFYREKHMRHRRPDGGDGGPGGDVIVRADRHLRTLLDFRYKRHFKAQRGGNGGSKNKKGKEGTDCVLKVPPGTIIRDADTSLLIKDLSEDGQSIVVAKGGAGGIGNANKKTPTEPRSGEERNIGLELKLIADVGLIGFPNAGKSTLISKISRVKSKVANYPFTTKQPILGFVHVGDDVEGGEFIIADLPGIIEGAHQGKGLGDRFLRHAERTKILLHVIDMAGSEGRDPVRDFEILTRELENYGEKVAAKKRRVIANKMDLAGASENLKRFTEKIRLDVYPVSAKEGQGLKDLPERIYSWLTA